MGHEAPKIIDELDFVLTHPAVNVKHLERFYHNSLLLYETVPLFKIIDYMMKVKPQMLNEWSAINKTVNTLLNEMDPAREKDVSAIITVNIDLSAIIPTPNGIYQVAWETNIEEPIVNAYFKTKSLHVIDRHAGRLNLVGISQLDQNHYHLYVKKRRKAV